MTAITGRVSVDVPPEDVFRYVSDLTNGPEWIPFLERAEPTSESTDGLELEGDLVARIAGRAWPGTGRTVGWDPPWLFTFETAFEGGATSVVSAEVEPRESGGSDLYATVEYEIPAKGLGRLAVGALGERTVRRELEKALLALKERLETPPASAS